MFKFIILGSVALLALAFVLPIVVRSGKKTAKAILETDQPKPVSGKAEEAPASNAKMGYTERELSDVESPQKDV